MQITTRTKKSCLEPSFEVCKEFCEVNAHIRLQCKRASSLHKHISSKDGDMILAYVLQPLQQSSAAAFSLEVCSSLNLADAAGRHGQQRVEHLQAHLPTDSEIPMSIQTAHPF